MTNKLPYLFKNMIINEKLRICQRRSTTTKFVFYKNFISNFFVQRNRVNFLHTDFNKAFDPVSHQILLIKLFSD